MANLPETLDETYERIIKDLLKRNKRGAIDLLRFLTFAERPLRLDEAVDAVAVDLSCTPPFEEINRMPDKLEVVRLCSSLVVLEEHNWLIDPDDWDYDGVQIRLIKALAHQIETGHTKKPKSQDRSRLRLQLAHFSVKEYLVSDRAQESLRQHFSYSHAHACLAKTSLGYMTSVLPYAKGDREVDSQNFPFLRYAVPMWPKHVEHAGKDGPTLNASRDFLKDQSLVQAWSCLNRNPTFQERMKAMEPRMRLIKESGVVDYLENPTRYNMAKILFKGVFRWLRESTWTIVSGFSTATESIATPILTASSQGLSEVVDTHT